MSLYEESNQFRAELEQQVENVDIREITQLPNFKNWFNSKKAHSKCYDYDLPKLFYRTLNSIDNLDNIVNGNEQSRFVGEYFTDDLDTALTYVEHLENSKILIGFLNIQNPAIIDCNGAGWNEIRQNATVTEQLAYFEYLGFNEKPDNFEENRAYPIDLRNDEKDESISFFLQIKTINKDTTPSFIKITAPQYYQNDKSFRKTKFINLDMLGYGTPSLFNDIGTTNFWATNLAHRHRFDSVIFENLNDDGGRGVTLFEKSVKKRKMQGTVVCAFDRENSYFKHANNHGDFNPDDRRIFYSLFEIEEDFKQELKTEKDKTMQQTQTTALQGGISSPKNYENTANYDVRGLPEFSGSVSAYFNNSKRQELVLAFKQTLERSSDLRHQHFIGIHPKQQVQFERIAAFSPLELSAILDCKPEFTNNMREYIAVVEDFERNNQQQQEAHKKAADALRISPAYQEMNDKRKNWARIDLYSKYIDGGEKFARAKTGEITNGDRLKQAIANAIETIAPAVKYSLNQEEFWQERDDKAFIKQSQIRDLLRSQMSFPAEMVEVKTRHQIWYEDRDMHDTLSKSTAGFFTPKNGKTVVIADAFIDNPELAVFTAYHELGHRGIELQGRELWNDWLQQARQNPTVRAIADHAQVHYASKGNILSDIAATEEALVEVFAAYKTQNWDYLAQRHKVEIPQEFRQPQGTAEKLWHAAKNRIGQIFGRQPETLPDSAVFAMLGKLEQSLYQFPEWKQKLEKTVRVGQHNPFVVAKQPIISGRPRVNPTALTNRYRSGGLRFDLLNVADNSEFAKTVDDIANGGSASKKHITLGTTPEVLAMIGLPETRINIRVDTIQKAMGEHLNLQDHSHSHIHNLTPETLKQIPEQLNNPIAVMKSAQSSSNPNGFVVLTELTETDSKTGKDKPVVAILDLHPTNQGLEVITVRSVYGRSLMQVEKGLTNDLLYLHTTKGSQFVKDFGLRLPSDALSTANLVSLNVKTNEDLMQYRKDKQMQKIEERYYANTPKDAMSYKDFVALWEEKNTGEKMVEDALKFMHRQQSLETWQNSFVFENVRNIYSELHQHRLLLTEQTEIKVVAPFEWNKDLAEERFNSAVLGLRLGLENEQFHQEVERFVANYEKQKQEIAEFFGIEQSQVAEFLGYEEPKELLEQAQQIISQNNPTVLHDMNGLPEKEKNMQNIEQRYYAKFPNATRSEKFAELAKEQGKTDEEIKNALTDIFDEHFRGEQWEDKFSKSFVLDIPTNLDWEDKEATFVPVIMPLEEVKSEMRFTLSDDLSGDLSRYLSDYKESGALVNLEYAIAAYEEYRQKTADFFGIEQSQVAEFLGYEEPKELLEQARQIISGSPEQTVEVKQDAFSQSEKENTMNETEKQALAKAFKAIESFDTGLAWHEVKMVKELKNRPESEIVAALAWDEVATAMKDFVANQSTPNCRKLHNAYLAYPLYNELASKGIPNDEDLRRQYGEVVADKHYSSFDERRTAALFILQSVWNGRGNTTSITRSYNIDAMTSYIARTQPEYFDSYSVGDSVTNHFLTKNSIFTHKNLREMGLDNNSNLAPYAPELLQEMVKIEEQHRVFSQWQNQNSEGGWHNRGAENIIDFKQIPAAVQKDLILMVSDRYSSKRDIFGVYDNPVASMQHGLAVRSEVQHNLEMLIEQQEKELQRYQKMGLGVPVPQEDAITQQINAYKETLEQVKNAPAVAFVPEKLFVVGETKPDWRTGEVQRYKTTEINTKTGEIAFVNDPNNPNPNPFGDMTEQARQYLSANNNFALAALGVTTRKMPENMKFDDFGTTETEPRLGDEIITLSNVRLPELILNAHLIGDNGHPLERNSPQFNFETPELKEEQEYISKVAKLLSDNELQKVQTLSNQLSSLRDLRQSYFDNNQGELVNDMNKHITLLERQIGNEVLGAYHNPQRLQEHIIDMEFRLIEIKNSQRANWDMRYYQSAAYLEQQYKQINQNLDLRRQALQTLVNAYPHLKDIQENIAASISLDGNALKWKKEIVKDEYGFNQNQYKSNLGDFVIKELREVGAFETKHNGKGFSFKTLKAAKEQVEYWYKEQQLRAELPKTPQVKFDMFEQGVSMPTNNVETQPETVYEFNNGCFVIISNNFADNIDKNGNGDFDNEAQLLHKDYPESLATYYYSVEGVDDNSSAIHLFDNLGRKDYDNFRNYEVDLSNPNWQQDLAKEMVSFVVSKEIINGLDKQQPAEIVKISNGADFWREMSVQMETQRIEQNRIEKREQVFNMITASGVMNTAWNGDETHGTESVLDTPFINKSLYYQDGELVYKDANYEHFETPDIFKISKQDFERHSPQAIALAVMKGVEEYKKMYRPEKAPEQSPTKRNDLQHTVNVGLQQYDNMFSPEIQKTHRLDILASQEKHRSHSVSGSPKEQTAENGGIFSPENSVKFDDFGVSESVPFAEKIFQSTAENLHKIEQVKQNPDEDPEKNKRMIKMLTGMHDYIERLKDNYHKATNSGDNLLAASHLESVSINQELFDQRFDHWIENTVKHDLNTPKTLTPQEQALKDGKDLSAAEIKVRDSKWELAKQPNNAERKTAYEQAQAELTALKSEIKERVQAAMDKGVPYIARYSEVPQEPFNGAKAPIEFAITPKGELTEVIGTTDTPHNLVPSNAGQGAVLNTEQRSSPQRIAEVLREHYQKSGILMQLDAINAVGGDKVFSELEIKKTLNRALKDYHPSSIRGALESPRMKDEWLQVVIDKHPNAEIRQAAQRVLEQRQGNLSQKPTAANGGVFLSAPQQHTTQQSVVAKKVMQPPTAVKTHRMRH